MSLFKQSCNSLGSQALVKNLRKKRIAMSRYKVSKLMIKLGLMVTQRVAYKVNTKRRYGNDAADN